jgi:glutamate transport system permease protein
MSSVLYDTPGPRTRAKTLIASIVAVPVILLLAYLFIYKPLADRNQFDWKLWSPILDPSDPNFALVWDRWKDGWLRTLKAAGLSMVFSFVLGSLLGLARRELRELRRRRFPDNPPPARTGLITSVLTGVGLSRGWVEIARGTPVYVTIMVVYIFLPRWGVSFDDRLWFLVIGLTIYNSVVIAEILRSGMENLPGGQREAALAVGLSSWQTSLLVLYPQALRIMMPALISQLVVVLKDTSLGGLTVSYEEALRTTQQMVEAFRGLNIANGIPMFATLGVMYILVNYGVSRLAIYLQGRMGGTRRQRRQLEQSLLIIDANAGGGHGAGVGTSDRL